VWSHLEFGSNIKFNKLHTKTNKFKFLILNSRRVLNVVFFLLGDSPSSEFYVQTFRDTLSVTSSSVVSAGRI
jgi:hypothetical protein